MKNAGIITILLGICIGAVSVLLSTTDLYDDTHSPPKSFTELLDSDIRSGFYRVEAPNGKAKYMTFGYERSDKLYEELKSKYGPVESSFGDMWAVAIPTRFALLLGVILTVIGTGFVLLSRQQKR